MAKQVNKMTEDDMIKFLIEHSGMETRDVLTISYQTSDQTLRDLIREVRRGWTPSIDQQEPDDRTPIDGIRILLTKGDETRILDSL